MGGATGALVAGLAYGLRSDDAPVRDEARRLTHRPPELAEPLVLDLADFDPTSPVPGWNGTAPSQRSTGLFPQDRDLLVLGHPSMPWTGGGFVRGGRNVHWLGGCYERGPWLRDFAGDGCVEGVLTRPAFSAEGSETGDGVSVLPAASTLGQSAVSVLNCRTENIDGLVEAGHGDCFQLPSSYDPPDGYSSTPRTVTIERFTGSTGYQGLFLANQHFDSLGYQISCRGLRLQEVNLRKTRPQAMATPGVIHPGNVRLIYFIDLSDGARGDRPYPIQLDRVHLEPWSDEGLDGCLFPDLDAIATSSRLDVRPRIASDGRSATFPPDLQIAGEVRLGSPSGGDFARAADDSGFGGVDVPGMGYVSPGYLAHD